MIIAFKVLKKELLKAVLREFLKRGLDKTYAKEIAEWQQYIDQKKFAVRLDKQMKAEIRRFKKTIKKWKTKELEEFVIEGLDCLK